MANTESRTTIGTERMSRLGLRAEPMGYVDGMNNYQAVGDNPINHLDPNGTFSTAYPPNPGQPNNYHGEFDGIVQTPYGTDPALLPTFDSLLKNIDLVAQLQNLGDVTAAMSEGYMEAESMGDIPRSIATHAGGEIIGQKTDDTFDVKGAIKDVVNNFIKAHACTHGFCLWIHIKYDVIEQSSRSFLEWLTGSPPGYEFVSHDEYVQCKLGSDPSDDTGQYGETGTGYYMPTTEQMRQMIKAAIEARGGIAPAVLNPPKPTVAGVVGAGGG